MALIIGFIFIAALGAAHHIGLVAIERYGPEPKTQPNLCIISTFVALLALHVLEILAFAVLYAALLDWPYMGRLAGDYDGSWGGLIYFSGINFTTLGYTQIEAEGPMRMINMMQSLGGFMLLTWSATFIYSMWEQIRG